MRGEILADAVAALRNGRSDQALALADRLLAVDGHDPDALTVRGMALQKAHRFDDAIAAMRAAQAADPDNPARAVNLGLALKSGGLHEQAVAMLERAVSARPDHAASLANLGSCLIAAGDADWAVPVLERAVALAAQDAAARNNLGVALARTGRDGDALAQYDAALAIRPAFHEARLNRADALLRLGRANDARSDAMAVLDADPSHRRAANVAGMAAEAMGDEDAAITIWRSAQRHGFSHPVGVNLMRLLLKRTQLDEVAPIAADLLAINPGSTTPLAYWAAALDRLGDCDAHDRLCDIDRFVAIVDIAAPQGFSDVDEFNRALEEELRADPSLVFEPDGLVTRSGRQTGDLADAVTPAIAALARLARAELAAHAQKLGTDCNHPFLAARPDEWSLTMWGTILQPGGAVEPHIHAPNWLSGVYYPAAVENDPAQSHAEHQGAFALGALPAALGGGGTQRILQPAAGRMILFPSFLWHRTLPFGGTRERLSLAFDMVPRGIGRPHRLPQ